MQQGFGEGSGEGSGEVCGEGCFGAEPGQVQQGSGEGSGERLGGFGAEPGQVQQDLRSFNSRKIKIERCRGYHRSLFDF